MAGFKTVNGGRAAGVPKMAGKSADGSSPKSGKVLATPSSGQTVHDLNVPPPPKNTPGPNSNGLFKHPKGSY